MISDFVKRLRKAADVLEDLLDTGNPFDNPKIAKKIIKNKPVKTVKTKKHWTQLPKNKARVKKMLRRAINIKIAQMKAKSKGRVLVVVPKKG
jgi:hypothetical protein